MRKVLELPRGNTVWITVDPAQWGLGLLVSLYKGPAVDVELYLGPIYVLFCIWIGKPPEGAMK